MAKCPICKKRYIEPEDEQGEHDCPYGCIEVDMCESCEKNVATIHDHYAPRKTIFVCGDCYDREHGERG